MALGSEPESPLSTSQPPVGVALTYDSAEVRQSFRESESDSNKPRHEVLTSGGIYVSTRGMTKEEYKERRIFLGLSQKKLGEVLGVTERTINRRERGDVPIMIEAILAIIEVCDIQAETLSSEGMSEHLETCARRFRGEDYYQTVIDELASMGEAEHKRRKQAG